MRCVGGKAYSSDHLSHDIRNASRKELVGSKDAKVGTFASSGVAKRSTSEVPH